jgi:hypothetical protein
MRRRFAHRDDDELRCAIWMMIYQLSGFDMWPADARKCDDLRALMIDAAVGGLSALDKPRRVPRAHTA